MSPLTLIQFQFRVQLKLFPWYPDYVRRYATEEALKEHKKGGGGKSRNSSSGGGGNSSTQQQQQQQQESDDSSSESSLTDFSEDEAQDMEL